VGHLLVPFERTKRCEMRGYGGFFALVASIERQTKLGCEWCSLIPVECHEDSATLQEQDRPES